MMLIDACRCDAKNCLEVFVSRGCECNRCQSTAQCYKVKESLAVFIANPGFQDFAHVYKRLALVGRGFAFLDVGFGVKSCRAAAGRGHHASKHGSCQHSQAKP